MALVPLLIYDENNDIMGERVFVIALVMGILGFIAFQFMIRNTVIRVDEEILVSEKREKFNVIKAMGNFLKNRPRWARRWPPWECFWACREPRRQTLSCSSPISTTRRFPVSLPCSR